MNPYIYFFFLNMSKVHFDDRLRQMSLENSRAYKETYRESATNMFHEWCLSSAPNQLSSIDITEQLMSWLFKQRLSVFRK